MTEFSPINTVKKIIEENLLASMKEIDKAINTISTQLQGDWGIEIGKLYNSKSEIKKVLNKHFDALARNKKNE